MRRILAQGLVVPEQGETASWRTILVMEQVGVEPPQLVVYAEYHPGTTRSDCQFGRYFDADDLEGASQTFLQSVQQDVQAIISVLTPAHN